MRIIGTDKNSKLLPLRQAGKTQNSKLPIGILIFAFCTFNLSLGYTQNKNLEQAQDYLKKSKEYRQSAANIYKELLSKGEEPDRLHFELGQLYYNSGDFKLAIEEFKQSADSKAKKLLAISYYRCGNFTDAFESFGKAAITDDECRYYYGLTCERLNLFDQALAIYKKIKRGEFLGFALERANIIEKQGNTSHIRNIDPQVYKILQIAPSAKKYPQAGALILYCDEKIEITPQNTQVSYMHYIVKILNERGKEGFSETSIDYDSTYEKVELLYARIIKPDGTVVEVGSRHIRDVSKYLNFPLYSNARAYIISFPEITEGAAIDYKLKIYRNQLVNDKDFIISYPLQASEPIIAANFSIDLPRLSLSKEEALHIKRLNDKYNNFKANLSPAVKEKDGRLTYSWHFRDIPQIIPESNMPPNAEINPTLLISTFNSWQEIYNWWWQLARDKIKADAAIKDKVKELTKGLNSEEKKARAIYNFCAQKIRYVAVEYGQAGYEPHFAADIFKNKYGDCKDQAILLATMLKEAGFSAWPVLIPTKDCYNLNPDFPSILFNHCIAAVSLKDKTIFLDPTAETCSFGDLPSDDQARQVFIVRENGYHIEKIPLSAAKQNLVRQKINIKLNSDEGMSATKSIFTYGIYDQAQRYWFLYTPPELIEEGLREKIQDVSIGAKLEKYDIKNTGDLNTPVVLSYAFKGPEYFTVAGKLRIMPRLAGLDTSLVAKDKRKYPIDFGLLDTIETIFEIEIPPEFTLKFIPESITDDNPWSRYRVEYNYKGNKIFFAQKKELKRNTVSQEEYADFKNSFEGLAKKLKQHIVLERIK